MRCMINNSLWYRTRTKNTVQFIFGMSILMVGCCIYLLFRSKTLNIYHWCSVLGLSDTIDNYRQITMLWNIPDFIRFSIPDGLYCTAYLVLMDIVWGDDSRWIKYLVLGIIPVVTIGSELLQYIGWVPGTFDVSDLICYSIPPLAYLGIHIINKYKLNNLRIRSL